jgi:hypothetical protein
MRSFLPLLIILSFFGRSSYGQITITAADMPTSGDQLRYSIAQVTGAGINLADSGTSMTWNYGSLTPLSQSVDTYKTALSVSILYSLVSFTAYGYKVADSLPGLGAVIPVSIQQLYTFFEKKSSPNSFAAVAFAAKIAGIPSPFNYTKDDTWYFFPLTYARNDSSNFALTIGLASVGSLKQIGYRKTRVDGWGTITTPYTTSPVNCIRVRSEIHGSDSISFGGPTIGFPQNTVEYKWLANGEHYPLLWVTTNVVGGTETISSIRFRDNYRALDVADAQQTAQVNAAPNPVINGFTTISVPAGWKQFSVTVYDITGKAVVETVNNSTVDMHQLPAGMYVAQVSNGYQNEFIQIQKQ